MNITPIYCSSSGQCLYLGIYLGIPVSVWHLKKCGHGHKSVPDRFSDMRICLFGYVFINVICS